MRAFIATALALTVAGCSTDERNTIQQANASATVKAADAFLLMLAQENPESGTSSDLPGTDHGALSDNSEAGIARQQAREDSLLIVVRQIPIEATSPDRVLHDVLQDALERTVASRVCRSDLWRVASYVNGWQASLTDLARVQPVGTDTRRAQALRRARAIARYIDNEIGLLKRGIEGGYSSPKIIVREVISQIDAILAAKPSESPFAAPLLRDSTVAFRVGYETIVRDSINPALRRYRDYLQNTYLAAAREALGVSSNPNGIECYSAVVRNFSTVAMPADSVYAIGQREITRLDSALKPLAKRLTGSDDVAKAMRTVTSVARFTFRTDSEIIAYAEAAQNRAKMAMPRAFGLHTELPVQIQPYPAFRARAGAPGQYQAPPDDGSRPPIHLLNTWDPTHKSRATIENTTFHETWPGHHQQIMVARQAKGQHRLLRVVFNSGFGEGWGLYAERVADELGLYSGDLDRFGYLASQKFRAARMVLDAGIHTRNMGYDEAVRFLGEQSTRSDREIRGEINRYISWPGQAPSYMIGNLEILRLREEARAKLGSKFDLRAFHDRVLGGGSVTLPLLRTLVTEWVAGYSGTRAPG